MPCDPFAAASLDSNINVETPWVRGLPIVACDGSGAMDETIEAETMADVLNATSWSKERLWRRANCSDCFNPLEWGATEREVTVSAARYKRRHTPHLVGHHIIILWLRDLARAKSVDGTRDGGVVIRQKSEGWPRYWYYVYGVKDGRLYFVSVSGACVGGIVDNRKCGAPFHKIIADCTFCCSQSPNLEPGMPLDF